MQRVVVVEDHTLLRQSLLKIVSALDGFEVVGEADRGDDAIRVVSREQPDIVLLDITMPGGTGLEIVPRLRAVVPDVRILMLTMHEDDAHITSALDLAVDGYIVKTASTDVLELGLRTIADGKTFLGPVAARRVIDLATGRHNAGLTERELEILTLLANGVRPTDMSAQLYVSLKTVKNHLTNIYTKLGVETAAQAVGEAYRRGLVPVPSFQAV